MISTINRAQLLFYLLPLTVAAFLVTSGTGLTGSLSGWGFPLPWKTGGCIQAIGGITCTAEAYDWPFFVIDALFYLLIGYAFLYVSYKLFPAKVDPGTIMGSRELLFMVLTASLVTLATGWLGSGSLASPGGFWGQSYGFPLSWKTTLASCPPPCIQANGTRYDWFSLAGDLLFYMASAYGMLLYVLRGPRGPLLKRRLESGKFLAVLALVVLALASGNYYYDSVYGTGNQWTGYGNLQLDHYAFKTVNLLTLWVRNYGPGTVALTSLYIANANTPQNQVMYPVSTTIEPTNLGIISENTTSQGPQLVQNGTYNVRIITSRSVQITFTVAWT